MRLIITTLSFLAGIPFSYAADLTPTEVYAKCFARLTNFPVNIDSQEYKDVAAGKKDPVTTCMSLFDRAQFVKNGNLSKIENENDKLAQGIVENFQRFHQSWFSTISNSGGGAERGLYSYVDFTAPALYITDALLGGHHYRSVFRRNDAIQGVRRSETTTAYVLDGFNVSARQPISGPLVGGNNRTEIENIDVLNFPKITQGRLVGVRGQPARMIANRSGHYRPTYEDRFFTTLIDDREKENIARFFGGGILGTPSYIMMNSEANSRLDGGVRVHRRLANNSMYDLLCLSLPNLRDDQVDQFLKTYKDSDLSFRQDKSCARCHASLDPFADTFRNIQVVLSSPNTFTQNVRAAGHSGLNSPMGLRYLKQFKVRTNQQVVSDNDLSYLRRQPVGQLYYNSISGKTVNLPVNGIQDLGNKISNQLDPYVCAAQRYYGFLTGVNVAVNSGETSDFYKNHRKEIMSLGKDLQKHGSLKKLVENILMTDTFQTRFPGYELTQGGE